MADAPWLYQYLSSLHWAVAQFTPGPQNIQPCNSTERLFAITVLLFGLVIFSSFIAGVTQARLQLAKLMSNLDVELWTLRKFCRQHGISRLLSIRMKRYIEKVIVPNFHKLSYAEVSLIPKLSAHLRSQLNSELVAASIVQHPFFGQLRRYHDSVMISVADLAIAHIPLARGDVVYTAGQVGTAIHLVADGMLDYLPVNSEDDLVSVTKGFWTSEASLWTKWVHQGQLQASVESRALLIDSAGLRKIMLNNGFVMTFAKNYASQFVAKLNEMAHQGQVSDLHHHIAHAIAPSLIKPKDINNQDIPATTSKQNIAPFFIKQHK
jgi:hypothetical protein